MSEIEDLRNECAEYKRQVIYHNRKHGEYLEENRKLTEQLQELEELRELRDIDGFLGTAKDWIITVLDDRDNAKSDTYKHILSTLKDLHREWAISKGRNPEKYTSTYTLAYNIITNILKDTNNV